MQKSAIDNIVLTLTKTLLTDSDSFEELAKTNSKLLELSDRSYLCDLLHNPPVYPEINQNELPLGQWLAMSQYSIFELFYNLGADSVELLKSFAFGKYDWTQATALEVLCRLCVESKISVSIIEEIDKKLEDMRYETHLYFAKSLVHRAKLDKRFEDIINRIENADFHEALTEINQN